MLLSISDCKTTLQKLVSSLAKAAGALVQRTGSLPFCLQDCKPLLSIARSRLTLPAGWYTVTDPTVALDIKDEMVMMVAFGWNILPSAYQGYIWPPALIGTFIPMSKI